MKMNPLAILSPMCLCMFAGAARADLEPFSVGASETLQHQSNLNHTDDAQIAPVSDWISTTEFNAALNQAIGRDKVVASAAVDFNRYRHTHGLNATGYHAAAEFDWNTVGDLSGSLGADSQRRQYIYGETADPTPGTPAVLIDTRNLQTDNHAFARIALGGESRWTIFGGFDANQRNYSNSSFAASEEHQWSTNLGTNYSTSPDLSFGITGAYVRGEYPHGAIAGGASDFNSKSINANTKWQASGSSAVDASLGFTTQSNAVLAGDRHFINGSFNWTWTPPSHFGITFGLKRSSDADTGTTGVTTGIVNVNNLRGTSINNVAHLDVRYELTAKINLDATADYTQRKYSGLQLLDSTVASGSTRTSRFFLNAHYQPTRTVDLSCGAGREIRHIDSGLAAVTPAYTDTYYQCAAAIRFD